MIWKYGCTQDRVSKYVEWSGKIFDTDLYTIEATCIYIGAYLALGGILPYKMITTILFSASLQK
jgi:hypothetical protein